MDLGCGMNEKTYEGVGVLWRKCHYHILNGCCSCPTGLHPLCEGPSASASVKRNDGAIATDAVEGGMQHSGAWAPRVCYTDLQVSVSTNMQVCSAGCPRICGADDPLQGENLCFQECSVNPGKLCDCRARGSGSAGKCLGLVTGKIIHTIAFTASRAIVQG